MTRLSRSFKRVNKRFLRHFVPLLRTFETGFITRFSCHISYRFNAFDTVLEPAVEPSGARARSSRGTPSITSTLSAKVGRWRLNLGEHATSLTAYPSIQIPNEERLRKHRLLQRFFARAQHKHCHT
jgi:hypothetical protein